MNSTLVAFLDVDRLRQLLAGKRLGLPLEYRAVTESTNDDAAALARAGAAEGTTVIADAQTRGRGRRGRVWVSPARKNVYVSVILRPPLPPEQAPQIAIVAGLAATVAIREVVPHAVLKWPNDVLCRGRKLCGILCELNAPHGDRLDFVVVGIGVNVNAEVSDFPPELRDVATSLRIETGASLAREPFAAGLLGVFGREYEDFLQHGFSRVRERWETLCGTVGREVEVDTGEQRFEGVVLGLSDTGHLRIHRRDNRDVEVVSGDVVLRERVAVVH